jgi:hypothetical protein
MIRALVLVVKKRKVACFFNITIASQTSPLTHINKMLKAGIYPTKSTNTNCFQNPIDVY